MEPETKPKFDKKEFNAARGNLAFSQRLMDTVMTQRNMRDQMAAPDEEEAPMEEAAPEQAPEQTPEQAPEAPKQPVEANPEEEVKKEAQGIQEVSQKVTDATEILKQGIEGLTAAVKEIAPAKSKLRDKLKGMLNHE